MLHIDFTLEIEDDRIPAAMDAMKSAMQKALSGEGLEDALCHVLLTGDEEIHALNKEFREIDSSTDVLSFPANDLEGPLADALAEGYEAETDPELDVIELGDIAISIPQAARQAEEYGNSFGEEMAFLGVHGILHLLGYDHMEPDEETVMREKQRIAMGRV